MKDVCVKYKNEISATDTLHFGIFNVFSDEEDWLVYDSLDSCSYIGYFQDEIDDPYVFIRHFDEDVGLLKYDGLSKGVEVTHEGHVLCDLKLSWEVQAWLVVCWRCSTTKFINRTLTLERMQNDNPQNLDCEDTED